MSIALNRLIILLFFLSGFCSLLYQVVWLRLAFASFGIVTSVVSILISVFMAGLALGSWMGGRWIEDVTRRTGISSIQFYALTEFFIGAGAFLVPWLFSASEKFLLVAGEMNSLHYMVLSSLFLAFSILPWCILMGFTFPLMIAFIRNADRVNTKSFSFLYLGNVIGAMSGTLLTAFVLVELFGFRSTSFIAATINFFIAVTSMIIGIQYPYRKQLQESSAVENRRSTGPSAPPDDHPWMLPVLFATGLTSMSMEVVWIRGFTPVLGTQIYSFAYILSVYLLGTWVGSSVYRGHLRSGTTVLYHWILAALSIAVFLPIVLNDPRMLQLLVPGREREMAVPLALASIFPFCVLLGYLTPQLIDAYSRGKPDGAGKAYAVNILGCIAGPIIASYLLLPFMSIRMSLVALAAPYLLALLYYFRVVAPRTRSSVAAGVLSCTLLVFSLAVSNSYEEYIRDFDRSSIVRRDHVATVVSYGQGKDKQLLINGVGITQITPITKYMAHLPLAFLDRPPETALVICFGMGTTYRSLLSWGVDATAVELVPSVRDAFGFYFPDAGKVLADPKGRILIDDGRRYLKRTSRAFDIITIDSPPPVEAAGVSLLLSEEFYALAKKHLNHGGILHQWFPFGEDKILFATARAIANSFAFVKAFRSVEGWGVHFLASDEPLPALSAAEITRRMPEPARRDLLEWYPSMSIDRAINNVLVREIPLRNILIADTGIVISDDKPYNEYYMLRRLKAKTNRSFRVL